MRLMARVALAGALLVAISAAAQADDVVHFTNGTFMAVHSYRVDGDMIHVVLGSNAEMAFPSSLVEKIERSGRTLYAKGSPANVLAPEREGAGAGGAGLAFPVSAESQVPSRHRSAAGARPMAEGSPDRPQHISQTEMLRGHPNPAIRGVRTASTGVDTPGRPTLVPTLNDSQQPRTRAAGVPGGVYPRISARGGGGDGSERERPPAPPQTDAPEAPAEPAPDPGEAGGD
jgi:hypothetical protein